MATRSGKPYNHDTETPRRRTVSIKESTIEKLNTNGKEVESNLNISNMSHRELRGKKPRIKDNIETSDALATTDAGLATETNWIISVVPTKGKRKTVKAVDKINVEDTENDINMSNVTTKQLRRRSGANSTVDSKVVDTTYGKATGEDIETANGNDNEEDTEVASKELKKKKKKAKGGKKKKQKGKSSTEVAEDTTKMINNIIEKKRSSNEDLDQDSIKPKNKKLRSKKSKVNSTGLEKENVVDNKEESNNSIVTSNVENDMSLNSSSRRHSRKRKSITQDTTFEKEDNVSMSNRKDNMSSNNSIEKELYLNTSNVSNKNLRNRKSLARDTTFEKEDNISINNKKDIAFSNNSVEKEIDFNTSNVSNKNLRSRKSLAIDTTFDKEPSINDTADKNNISKELYLNSNTPNKSLRSRQSTVDTTFEKHKDTTYEKVDKKDVTFDKSEAEDMTKKNDKRSVNTTYDKNETYEKDHASFDSFKKGASTRKSSIQDVSFDKKISIHSLTNDELSKDNVLSSSLRKSLRRQTLDCSYLDNLKLDCITSEPKRKSQRLSAATEHILNTTFEKEPIEKESKSSLISSDNSEISRISITSDDTEEIINTTPVLIESSMDETVNSSPQKQPTAQTHLKREGTFTKDAPEVQSPQTPSKGVLTPMAGCTPYHVGKSSQKKPMMNVTRSLEKRLSVDPAPRMTRVMFCSPVDNPTVCQEKRKVIKSNLKGSNKSFVFDDTAALPRPARKRSYTHNDADDARVKRSRLAEDLQQSVDRLSRPRTNNTAKNNETTPKKSATPFKSKSETKLVRTRLPNFAALHQKQFDKMESLDECQERKAKRARQMLTPNGATKMLERISPKNTAELEKPNEQIAPKDKPETPSKKFTLESLRPGFTRFGFKLNLDINPFTIATKTDKTIKPNVLKKAQPNGLILRQGIFPSLAGTTRRDIAKQTVMREKSSLEKKRNMTRNENRTIIKGVRTNRRFELQMKLRNIE